MVYYDHAVTSAHDALSKGPILFRASCFFCLFSSASKQFTFLALVRIQLQKMTASLVAQAHAPLAFDQLPIKDKRFIGDIPLNIVYNTTRHTTARGDHAINMYALILAPGETMR